MSNKQDNAIKNLEQSVLEKISNDGILATPPWKFKFLSLFWSAVGIALIAAFLMVCSLTIYTVHNNGLVFLAQLGGEGTTILLKIFPWPVFFISISLFLVIVAGSCRLELVYRRPLVLSATIMAVVLCFTAYFIALGTFHSRRIDKLRNNVFYGLSPLHEMTISRHSRNFIHRGTVMTIRTPDFLIRDAKNEILHVMTTPQTFFFDEYLLNSGDGVLIFGSREQDTIRARGVKHVERAIFETPK